jgi:hypothetical protein
MRDTAGLLLEAETVYRSRAHEFPPTGFLVGSALFIFYFLFFSCPIMCLYVLSFVLRCRYDFRIQTMFYSSLLPVVCRRDHVSFTLFVFFIGRPMSHLRYLCLFVGGLTSHLRYLCLFVGGITSHLRFLCLFVGGLTSHLRYLCLFVGGITSHLRFLCLFVGGLTSHLRFLCLFVGGITSHLLFLCLFVGGLTSHLRYLCLLAHSSVKHILCCVLFFFVNVFFKNFVICLFIKKSRGRYKYRKKTYDMHIQFFSRQKTFNL